MAYDFGAIDVALAAAAGNDDSLAVELRKIFLDSARQHADLLGRARCDANWRQAGQRLQGLAASFGALGLLTAAEFALDSAPSDPVALRKVKRAIDLVAV